MTSADKPVTYASRCMDDHKQQIAREIRKQIDENQMKRAVAEEIFGVSQRAIYRIMNYQERDMAFELLFHAAVTAGIVVSITLTVPE